MAAREHNAAEPQANEASAADGTAPPAAATELTGLAMQGDWDRIWEEEWKSFLWQEAQARVRRKAEPKQFQIFQAHAAQGRSAAQVAKRFGITEEQVYQDTRRIKALLPAEVQALQREGA